MVFGWGLTAMIWRGFHSHGGTLIAGWFMENPVKMDDLGVPPICGTSHISTVTMVDEAKHGGFNTNLGSPVTTMVVSIRSHGSFMDDWGGYSPCTLEKLRGIHYETREDGSNPTPVGTWLYLLVYNVS